MTDYQLSIHHKYASLKCTSKLNNKKTVDGKCEFYLMFTVSIFTDTFKLESTIIILDKTALECYRYQSRNLKNEKIISSTIISLFICSAELRLIEKSSGGQKIRTKDRNYFLFTVFELRP